MENMQVYILARNEEPNIGACLRALQRPGLSVTVLDSGSTDGTASESARFPNATVEHYAYSTHCEAYNWITSQKTASSYVMILDADMRIEDGLWDEICELVGVGGPAVISAPVTMCVDGVPLKYGSLYPPKPIVFRTGAVYFKADGHGEKLLPDTDVKTCRAHLVHDDRKPYESFLESQCRYSRNFIRRGAEGKLDWQDSLRARTGLVIWLAPLYSWLVRRGWLCGTAGKAYALDRMIAEAVRRRFILADKLQKDPARRA